MISSRTRKRLQRKLTVNHYAAGDSWETADHPEETSYVRNKVSDSRKGNLSDQSDCSIKPVSERSRFQRNKETGTYQLLEA